MKKLYLSLILILCLQITYSQDTINNLKEVVIEKKGSIKKEIASIIKKIKYNLRENYEAENVNYFIKHFSLKDKRDTLVNRKIFNNFKIKILSQNYISWMLSGDPHNSFHKDTSPYSEFEPSSDDVHWLALSIFYDSLKVVDFDFFNIYNNYKYEISKVDDITTVRFTAHKYYTGYFSFNNKNYNLIRIVFMNTIPYDYYVSDNHFEFASKWKYNKVTIKLDFMETNKGKLLLANLDAMQELTNFKFTRYDYSRKIIAQDFNSKFYTTLQMKIIH